jgi:hypothetical protein
MTVEKLHQLTGKLLAKKQGNIEVAINHARFMESENGTILTVESATVRHIQGADDSGPRGPKFPFLVLEG